MLVLGAVGLVGTVGLVVYGLLGDMPGTLRAVAERWDSPAGDDRTPQAFVVRPRQSAAEIGADLEARGLVRSALVFRVLAEARGVGGRIEAGEYQLSPAMTTGEVVAVLGGGAARPRGVVVTVPEGWRAEQVAQRVEELGLGSSAEFMALVRGGAASLSSGALPGAGAGPAPPLAGLIPPGQSLEGYLFPDTYELPRDARPRAVVELMVRQYDQRVGEHLRQRLAATGLSMHEAVTLASIVEREATQPAERPVIAGVYLNRLKADMPLQADPTVQYAVTNADLARAASFGFWKRNLTLDDLRIPSPYNTYAQRGLPPGPICSPGLDAIQAVANPTQTDYYYFVARGDGSHVFARSEPEHRANVERYQSGQ